MKRYRIEWTDTFCKEIVAETLEEAKVMAVRKGDYDVDWVEGSTIYRVTEEFAGNVGRYDHNKRYSRGPDSCRTLDEIKEKYPECNIKRVGDAIIVDCGGCPILYDLVE